jgi:hypothetical protein
LEKKSKFETVRKARKKLEIVGEVILISALGFIELRFGKKDFEASLTLNSVK